MSESDDEELQLALARSIETVNQEQTKTGVQLEGSHLVAGKKVLAREVSSSTQKIELDGASARRPRRNVPRPKYTDDHEVLEIDSSSKEDDPEPPPKEKKAKLVRGVRETPSNRGRIHVQKKEKQEQDGGDFQEDLPEYEIRRRENMERNRKFLESLGLEEATKDIKKRTPGRRFIARRCFQCCWYSKWIVVGNRQ
jgi:hypothetical protein